jgi:hypothetical protein
VIGLKVKINVSIASASWSYYPGQIVDLPDEMAKTWVKSGIAEVVDDGAEADNPSGKRAGKSGRGKGVSAG